MGVYGPSKIKNHWHLVSFVFSEHQASIDSWFDKAELALGHMIALHLPNITWLDYLEKEQVFLITAQLCSASLLSSHHSTVRFLSRFCLVFHSSISSVCFTACMGDFPDLVCFLGWDGGLNLGLHAAFFFFNVFWWSWGWTQSFALAGQALLSTWTTTLASFVLVILEIGSWFLPRMAWTWMAGVHHLVQHFSIKMGSHKLFCPGWPRTLILLPK
jgi:hypothetical protein